MTHTQTTTHSHFGSLTAVHITVSEFIAVHSSEFGVSILADKTNTLKKMPAIMFMITLMFLPGRRHGHYPYVDDLHRGVARQTRPPQKGLNVAQ